MFKITLSLRYFKKQTPQLCQFITV